MMLLARSSDSMMFLLPNHKSNPTDLQLWKLVYEETSADDFHGQLLFPLYVAMLCRN
jgi:hypothetical protein